MPETPRTTIDDQAGAPGGALAATVIAMLAYASFAAYLLNGYAVEQFLAEFAHLKINRPR